MDPSGPAKAVAAREFGRVTTAMVAAAEVRKEFSAG
jgi:hypothetical protein